MILHALEIVRQGNDVDFYTQNTDWFVLILRKFNDMGNQPEILTGTKDTRRKVDLTPIYQALGQDRAEA